MIKEYLFFWGKALLFLPGTFMHELAHFTVGLIGAKRIPDFSILPHRESSGGWFKWIVCLFSPPSLRSSDCRATGYQYGHVIPYPLFGFQLFFIGLAPVSLWYLLWWILGQRGLLDVSTIQDAMNAGNLWLIPVSFWLLWGGKPSSTDIRVAANAILSPSSIILIIAGVLIFYFDDFREEYVAPIWYSVVDFTMDFYEWVTNIAKRNMG